MAVFQEIGLPFPARELGSGVAHIAVLAKGGLDVVRAAAHVRLGLCGAKARRLSRAESRFRHRAATAPLLSDQLEARKHAVLLGVRVHAANMRLNGLRKALDAATAELRSAQNRMNAVPFTPSAPTLLSAPLFGPAGSSSGVVSVALQ